MECLQVYQAPATKVRIGKPNDDGGYAVCQLPGEYDILLSGGVANDITFEEDFLRRYPSTPVCLAFDGTVQQFPPTKERIHFIPYNLGAEENEQKKVTNWHFLLQKHRDAFVKMDIEGHEFRILPTWSTDMYRHIKQMVIEVHGPGDMHRVPDYYKEFQDITHETLFNLMATIQKTHTLVHFHPNNGCFFHFYEGKKFPNTFECTFVRNDFMKEKVKSTDSIPSVLDVRNHSWYPEMELPGWPYIDHLAERPVS